MDPLPVGMKMLSCSANLKMQGDTAIYTVKYKGAADSIVWRMAPDGLLGMDALVLNYRAKETSLTVYTLTVRFLISVFHSLFLKRTSVGCVG